MSNSSTIDITNNNDVKPTLDIIAVPSIYEKKKKHYLIVEGQTDIDFFTLLFENYSCFHEGKKIKFPIKDKDNIIAESFEVTQRIDNITHEIENVYPGEIHKKENSIENTIKTNRRYELVTLCVKHLTDRNIEAYGIIDNDFGHEELICGMKNITVSSLHDRESTLLRWFLPDCIEQNVEKTRRLSVSICKVFKLLIKQGILEECSINYQKTNNKGYIEKYKRISHGYFKDNVLNIYVDGFDFNEYLDNPQKFDDDLNGAKYFNQIENIKYNQFKEYVKQKIKDEFNFESKLDDLILKWLRKDKMQNKDIDNLNTIFKYCNGHFLITLLRRKCKNDLFCFSNERLTDEDNLSDEEKFILKRITRDVIVKRYKYVVLFDNFPLNNYKNFREDNELYEEI